MAAYLTKDPTYLKLLGSTPRPLYKTRIYTRPWSFYKTLLTFLQDLEKVLRFLQDPEKMLRYLQDPENLLREKKFKNKTLKIFLVKNFKKLPVF